MREVAIMSGVSGSGKSTFASEHFLGEFEGRNGTLTLCERGVLVSADNFFLTPEEEYRFDATKLTEAHADCFRRFIIALQEKHELVVVDNTNTTIHEINPYVLGAEAFGYKSSIITLMCETDDDLQVAAARNVHSVPYETILNQHRRLQERRLPIQWDQHRLWALFD